MVTSLKDMELGEGVVKVTHQNGGCMKLNLDFSLITKKPLAFRMQRFKSVCENCVFWYRLHLPPFHSSL
jgi:hypothetical protein